MKSLQCDVNEPFAVYAICNVKLYCASNEMMKMNISQLCIDYILKDFLQS